MHFGHANLLRQAKELGDYLIVGVHSDEEVSKNKGPPVYNEQERYRLVKALKWVDEVVEDSPYCATVDLLEEQNCDFIVHGDDISVTASGDDAYRMIKESGKYREVSRTQGVSTTDIVGRMLLMTKTHHKRKGEDVPDSDRVHAIQTGASAHSPYTGVSQFLATTNKIVQFSSGKQPKPGDKIVYVCGAFDCFHIGHLSFLEAAAKLGDFIIVGVHTDSEVNRYLGSNYPIMNLHERVLSVLACRHVHEVVIGAPFTITEELMNHFKVDLVVHGNSTVNADSQGNDPYELPKKKGCFKHVDSGSSLTTADIVDRIIENRMRYIQRNEKKEAREIVFDNNNNGH